MRSATTTRATLTAGAVSAVTVLAMLLASCGSSEEESGGDATDEFCARLTAASEQETLSIDEDPAGAEAAAQEMRALAADAPEQVAGAIETLADVLDELAALGSSQAGDQGQGDMEDFGRVMALMFDPKVIKAGGAIEAFAVSECGMDPEVAAGRFGEGTQDGAAAGGTDPFEDSGDPGAEELPGEDVGAQGEISLEDLDAVEESHAGESWSGKIVSSSIANDTSIELYGKGPDDEFIDTEPLTVDESVAACEAMRGAFSPDQPELEVRVGNGETVLAEGTAAKACAAA